MIINKLIGLGTSVTSNIKAVSMDILLPRPRNVHTYSIDVTKVGLSGVTS